MPSLLASGVAQITIKGMWSATIPLASVFHCNRLDANGSSSWGTQALQDAADRFDRAFALFLPNLATGANFLQVVARDRTTNPGAVITKEINRLGTNAANSTGPYEGPLIRWLTTLGGRTNGRTYLPGIDEASVDGVGMVAPARVTAMTGMAQSFLTFLSAPTDATHLGSPLGLIVVSSKPALNGEAAWYNVVGASCRPMIGIQRDRRPGQ